MSKAEELATEIAERLLVLLAEANGPRIRIPEDLIVLLQAWGSLRAAELMGRPAGWLNPAGTMPGRFYSVQGNVPVEVPPVDQVDVWVCRRVADFPDGLPDQCAASPCTRCGELVAYQRDRKIKGPRICNQCAGR